MGQHSNRSLIKLKKNSNIDKIQQIILWQNATTQIVTKLKTQILIKITISTKVFCYEHFDTLTTDEMYSRQSGSSKTVKCANSGNWFNRGKKFNIFYSGAHERRKQTISVVAGVMCLLFCQCYQMLQSEVYWQAVSYFQTNE